MKVAHGALLNLPLPLGEGRGEGNGHGERRLSFSGVALVGRGPLVTPLLRCHGLLALCAAPPRHLLVSASSSVGAERRRPRDTAGAVSRGVLTPRAVCLIAPTTAAGACVVRPSWPDTTRAGSPGYARRPPRSGSRSRPISISISIAIPTRRPVRSPHSRPHPALSPC